MPWLPPQSISADDLASELQLASHEFVALLEMEIAELRERRGLMTATELREHYALHPLPEEWDPAFVASVLRDAGLGAYAAAFEKAKVDGRALLQLSASQIEELLAAGVADNAHEQNEAAAELLGAIQKHLRWRSAGRGDDQDDSAAGGAGQDTGSKMEL